VKALTICQPYAELIARSLKRVENRTWPTRYRGRLAIHAGKSRDWLDEDDLKTYPNMVFGAVVAVATLADCVRSEDILNGKIWLHLANHAHVEGPWCWVLEDVQPLEKPLTWRGAQGLWPISEAALR
jgi:hypothetical protein